MRNDNKQLVLMKNQNEERESKPTNNHSIYALLRQFHHFAVTFFLLPAPFRRGSLRFIPPSAILHDRVVPAVYSSQFLGISQYKKKQG